MARLIYGSVAYVYHYKGKLFTSLLVPLIIMTLVDVISYNQSAPNVIFQISSSIFEILFYTTIAVTTHRIILLGPSVIPRWGIVKVTKCEIKFILYTIALSVLLYFISLISIIPSVGIILGLVLIMCFVARLSLVFPAIAIGRNWSFSDSWNATKNHQGKAIIATVLVPIFTGIPVILVSLVEPYGEFLSAFLSSLMLIFTFSALSVLYQIVIEDSRS